MMCRPGFLCFLSRVPWVFVGIFLLGATPAQAQRSGTNAWRDGFPLLSRQNTEKRPRVALSLQHHFEYDAGQIVRESKANVCTALPGATCGPFAEFDVVNTQHLLNIEAAFLLTDFVALQIHLPWLVSQNHAFAYAAGVSGGNSTLDPGGPRVLIPDDTTSSFSGAQGLGLGLLWTPLAPHRNPWHARWNVGARWYLPYVGGIYRPQRDAATSQNPGPGQDGMHRLQFSTSFMRTPKRKRSDWSSTQSERFPFASAAPYLDMSYTLPIAQAGFTPDPFVKTANRPFGRSASHIVAVSGGTRIHATSNAGKAGDLWVELGIDGTFTSEGRNISLISQPLQEYTYTEQSLRVGGHVGFDAQVTSNMWLRASFGLSTLTDYWLSFEDVGEDGNGDGQVDDDSADSPNPYFCGNDSSDACSQNNAISIDQVGHRIGIQQDLGIDVQLGLGVTF